MKKLNLFTLVGLACLIPTGLTTHASSINEASVQLNGTIEPSVISFSVPANVSFSINPNDESGNYFITPDLDITNTSNLPLNISVLNLEQAADSGHTFTDVLPTTHTDEEWENLNKTQSERDLALGLTVTDDSQWLNTVANSTIWAKEVQDDPSGTGILIGSIPSKGTVRLNLTAKHGLSFANALTTKYQATVLFDLLP